MLQFLPKISSLARRAAGFTMIELLIVITILGILAVAVLSAINPIEQINRGRDTGSRSDAEQLISAIDRFQAFQGYYPWVANPVDPYALPAGGASMVAVSNETVAGDNPAAIWYGTKLGTDSQPCSVLSLLAQGSTTCTGTDELKVTFLNKVSTTGYNRLYIYNMGSTATVRSPSTYVCFVPTSGAFEQEAKDRCDVAVNGALPEDFPTAFACGGGVDGSGTEDFLSCLP